MARVSTEKQRRQLTEKEAWEIDCVHWSCFNDIIFWNGMLKGDMPTAEDDNKYRVAYNNASSLDIFSDTPFFL